MLRNRAELGAFVGVFVSLFAIACGRSAQGYLDSGNKYFQSGKYDDASLNYRKAIQKEPRLGEAHYRLGLAEIEQKQAAEALQSLRQAAELLPDRADVKVTLADLTLAAYQANPQNQVLYDMLKKLTAELRSKDPNSFDALRMNGNVALLDRKSDDAVEYFRRANEIKPLQEFVIVGYVRALIDVGRGEEAERLARQLMAQKKDFAPIYELLYQYYISAGRTSAGEAVLQEMIQNSPQNPNGVIQLAAHHARAQNTTAMRAALTQLTESRSIENAYLLVGDFYIQLGDWENALANYEQGLKAHADQGAYYLKRIAAVRAAQNRPEDAIGVLEQVLSKNPKDQEALLLKANLLLDRGHSEDTETVISIYQTLLKERDDVPLQVNLGRAYLAKNDLVSARKMLVGALQRDPAADGTRVLLATVSLLEGKSAEALGYLDVVLAKSPGDAHSRFLKTAALMNLARYDEARAMLDKLAHDFPKSKDLQVQQGLLALLSKRYKDAETIFSQLPSDQYAGARVVGIAESYVAQQQFDRALKLLESDAKKDPKSIPVRRALAKTLIQAGQYDRAISELQALVLEQPKSPQLLLELAEAHRAKGDFQGATSQLEKALLVAPKSSRLQLTLAFTLNQAGKAPEAIAIYRKLVAEQPDNSLALNNLAYAMAETGGTKELEEGLQLAQHAVQLSPKEPDIRDTLGWVYLKKGMADSALQVFTGLSRERPENTTYRYHMALALLAKGDSTGARTALEAALANRPAELEASQIKQALKQAEARR